jgi:hypothetical protein
LGDETAATTICPIRLQEDSRMFVDAGRLAFGSGQELVVVPEFKLLRIPETNKRIGKIDFVLAQLDTNGKPTDFAALEVQSVYISGRSIRPAFNRYLKTGEYDAIQKNRPDFRSSAQKRLMPQLSLKVPVFRRWGKRFFVVTDAAFFEAMPRIKTVPGAGNSEVTWLIYPLVRRASGVGYKYGDPTIVFTQWDDVLSALREGEPPEKSEVLVDIQARVPLLQRFKT